MKKRFEFLLFMCGDMYMHTYEKAIINNHLSLSGLISRVEINCSRISTLTQVQKIFYPRLCPSEKILGNA